jgi:predicted lysophospholipase L1 biosynthesis ABC-type transport system permease subunit
MPTLLLAQFRRYWLEYLLGAAAIGLVVAALVAQRAITASADGAVHDLAHRLGRNMLVLPAGTDAAEFHRQRYDRAGMAEDVPGRIMASPLAQHVRAIQARLYGNAVVAGTPVVLVGEASDWPPAPAGGTVPALAGGEVARRLGVGPGATLEVGGVRLSVVRIADPAPEGLDEALFVPLPAAQAILGRPGEINALRLGGCWCRIDVAALGGEIEKLLPGTRAITVAGMVDAQKGAVATMKRYSGWLEAAGLLLVALVVVGLVSSQARRRSRELGLLAAIGASPRSIAALFSLQAAAAGAVGGLAGWLAAVPLTRHLSERILGAAATPSAEMLLPAVVACALASAAVALVPAGRAAAADPTVVLRET